VGSARGMADSQRLFDALLGLDAPVGFAVLDTSHRYLAVNSVLARRHRRSAADHLGRRIEELAADGPTGSRAARVTTGWSTRVMSCTRTGRQNGWSMRQTCCGRPGIPCATGTGG
jgi:hypothetical protein